MTLATFRMHSREEFQTWLALDLDVREEFYALMGGDPGVEVDSLDPLEAWLLDRFATGEDALRLDQRGVTDAAARHVGRVLVLNVDDAVWEIDLDDENSLYYRLPVVRFADGTEECPLTMVTTCLDRREGTFLRELTEVYQEDYNTD